MTAMDTRLTPPPFAVCIMGPTASGKTDLAVELVKRFPFQIISVDSALIYKGMDIGTAKPEADVLRMAPHRLIDFLDPAEPYSAARFRKDALREMHQITAAGQIPLLVGGTMLYFRALINGLSDLPAADESVREKLEAQLQAYGLASLHTRLAEVDPVAAARIHPNDPQRIQRALEVYEITGVSLTEWQAQQSQGMAPYEFIKLGLIPSERAVLHERIARRFHQMLEQGLINEVECLYQRGDLDQNKPSIRAVGYRQVWEYLAGNLNYAEMVERGIIATRQLAKRQLTWLRSEPNMSDIDCLGKNVVDLALKILESRHIKAL